MSSSAGSNKVSRTILYRCVLRVKYNPRHRQHQPRGDYPNAVVHALEKDRDLYFNSSALARQIEEIRETNGRFQESIAELEREKEYLREKYYNAIKQIGHLEDGLDEVIHERDYLREKDNRKEQELKNAYLAFRKARKERDHYRLYWKKTERTVNQLFNVMADEQDTEQRPENGASSSSSHAPMS